jgi:hypothetical protein
MTGACPGKAIGDALCPKTTVSLLHNSDVRKARKNGCGSLEPHPLHRNPNASQSELTDDVAVVCGHKVTEDGPRQILGKEPDSSITHQDVSTSRVE